MSDGLRITFDPGLDHGAWPGPLATRSAAMGELWLGCAGFLARLETELGLGARRTNNTERAAALAALLTTRTGWWRPSFDTAPLATARRLLADRDQLCMWGWRGEPVSDRLVGLWTATRDARPGIPDRLRAVVDRLDVLRPEIESIEMHTSAASLEPLWRALFARLARAGVRIIDAAPPFATSRGDLAAARVSPFKPTGDGTLSLLRPHGPLAAADEVAASLAALPSREGVLIIGGDDILDDALARHGLPRIGAGGRPAASTSLLRLVVEAAFEPMHPADLHALLAMPVSPIPRRVGARLIGAISRLPGRRTEGWSTALAEGLAKCDESYRDEVATRVDTLLMPAVGRDALLLTSELARRLACLRAWATKRVHTSPTLVALASMIDEATELLAQYGMQASSLLQLRKICDEIAPAAGFGSMAQAGLASVASPASMLAPARVVVWWNFTRESAPGAQRIRLTQAERVGLASVGIEAPDPGLLMEGEARRWRRPLELASEALVLVCPSITEAGEECSPHPLWDELCAAMGSTRDAAPLVTQRLALPARRRPELRAFPVFAGTITTGATLLFREHESPSSLESLLGCSLRWALDYHARLDSGVSDGPGEPSPLLFGNLAHHVLALVFADGVIDGDAARARATQILDADLVRLAESLGLPHYQQSLAEVRQAILDSASGLGTWLTRAGARIRGVEIPHATVIDGLGIRGTADMVLDEPAAVVDLKWGKNKLVGKLENGSALQLAAYAQMFGAGDMQVAYYSVNKQLVMAPALSTLVDARMHGTVQPADTWKGALVTIGRRRTELQNGVLVAPHFDRSLDEVEVVLDASGLTLPPECGYCAHGALCGGGRCG